MNLRVDPARRAETTGAPTGILVRAQHEGEWGPHDIAVLDAESLLAWLKDRGGDNPAAENVVGILLGHGHLHAFTSS